MSEIAMSAAHLLGAVRRHLQGSPLRILVRLVAVGAFAVALLLAILATGAFVVIRPVVVTAVYAATVVILFFAYTFLLNPDDADEGPVA